MDTTQTRPQTPNIQFRVLVIGRANAGKTSILQRVCETTESPTIYRGNEEVKLNPSVNRGEHKIDDELVFSNHKGYVFHDSQGIEAGDEETLEILKEFIQRKCGEKSLRNKLHAIWYCVPMDDHRPGLNLKFFENICPDQNVPVIAVFTKYDQFLFNVEMDVSDDPDKYPDDDVSQVEEKRFQDHYLRPLGEAVRYVRLEKMHMKDSGCNALVEKTAAALNEDAVALMLLAVQKGNLELNVKTALSRVHQLVGFKVEQVIQECLIPFPYVWRWEFSFLFDAEYNNEFSLTYDYSDYSSDIGGEMRKDHFMKHVMTLPTIQNLNINGTRSYHLIIAFLIILKHATFLRKSNKPEAALTQAELDYQKANIDLKIQEYLKSFSPEDSVESFSGFIMATELVPSQFSVKTSA